MDANPLSYPERADARRPSTSTIPISALPGLGARDEQAVAQGRGDLLPALLCAQQRRPGGGGRRHARRGSPLAQATVWAQQAPTQRSPGASARKSRRPSRLAVFTSRTRVQARPLLLRYYRTPSYSRGAPGQAESLELLAWIVGDDDTSRLYRRLVAGNLASTAGANYDGNGLDRRPLGLRRHSACPGLRSKRAEAELDAIIADVRQNGVTQEELERAKSALEAQRVFESGQSDDAGEPLRARRSAWPLDRRPRCGTEPHPGDNPGRHQAGGRTSSSAPSAL